MTSLLLVPLIALGQYYRVVDEDAGLTRRSDIEFRGAAVCCVDNPAKNRTVCTVDAGVPATPAPTTAQYWTGAADSTLSAEKNLGALSTGLVLNTGGVPTAYAGSSCAANTVARSSNGSGALTCSAVSLSSADVANTLPQSKGGTGAGALACSSGEALTSNGTAQSCTATLTASDLVCSGTCVADAEIAAVAGAKVSGTVANATLAASATALASNPSPCSSNQFVTDIAANGTLSCSALVDADVPDTITVALASTATALAANPADCSAGQFATTIAASGALTCAAIADSDVPNNITVDLATTASTATALASNPTDCAANQFANAIAASGNLTCGAIGDSDVPDNITVSLAATATALAANPADCSANQFANAIAASGALTCGAIGDSDVPNNITIDLAATATALAANPADCSANQFATTIAASGALTCAALADADIPNTITVDLATAATALAANPADCTAGQYATAIAASGALTCTADPNVDETVVKLANDVGIAVSATYTNVWSVAMPNSKNVNITFHLSYIPTANTVGMQFTVESGDAANGNCVFTTYGISTTAASATLNEWDILPIQSVGTTTDTASAAACNNTACLVDVACTLTTDASAQNLVLKAQLETGTSNANIKAGSSYYTLVTN